jgi:hypothetical protein
MRDRVKLNATRRARAKVLLTAKVSPKQVRVAMSLKAVERVLRCDQCGECKVFDVRNDGYVTERCRCGTKFVGAVS